MGVQPFSTALFGVPFPLPTPQGRRAQQLKTRPECWIRGLHEASTQGIEATSANLFRKEWLWDAACCSTIQMLIFRNAIVTSHPWNRMAGGHAQS